MNAPYLRISFPGSSGRRLSKKDLVSAFENEIKRNIVRGGLRLPPVRVVAHQLDMSKTTIQEVYDELSARGLVENKSRVGIFIRSAGKRPAAAKRQAGARAVLPELFDDPGPSSAASEIAAPGYISLASAYLDPDLVPRRQLESCIRAALRKMGLSHNYEYQGSMKLREQIAVRLKRFGIEADPAHIVVTVGSQQALDMISRSLKDPVIAMESPCYLMGRRLYSVNRVRTVGLPLDPFKGVDLSLWESIISKERPSVVHVVTSFQNPTGYSYSSAELSAILEWSGKYGFGIIEDDWGSEMMSHSEYRLSMRAAGGDAVFYVNSFTKKVLPSLRIGYVAGNARSIKALQSAKRATTLGSSLLMEAALGEFLERGYYDEHIRKVQASLDRKYALTLAAMRELMPGEVRWTTPGGGPFMWLELPECIDAGAFIEKMRERGVILYSSAEAYWDRPHLNGMRVNFAYNPIEKTVDALGRMAETIREMSCAAKA